MDDKGEELKMNDFMIFVGKWMNLGDYYAEQNNPILKILWWNIPSDLWMLKHMGAGDRNSVD